LPSQRSLIAATRAGKEQDALLSQRAKQRSIHNNYLTFPLLFIMVSNHFPSATHNHLNWLVLFVLMIGGAAVRHFMNVRYAGKLWLGPAIVFAYRSAMHARSASTQEASEFDEQSFDHVMRDCPL